MKPNLSWNDINSGEIKEIKKHYKMSERDVERQVRKHTYGATKDELRSFYEKVYRK